MGQPLTLEGGRRWQFLAELARQFKLTTMVEVGCKEGRTTEYLAENVPHSRVWAIDPWRPFAENAGREGGETYEEWDFAKIEAEFRERTRRFGGRVRHVRKTSEEAAPDFTTGGTDLVFIDAAHDYENCLADIDLWLPKVRPGGFLAGHDYQHKFVGVMRAVADRFPLIHVGLGSDSVWFYQVPA